jgi:transposase InsO family protein
LPLKEIRRFVVTTGSGQELPAAENKLNQNFSTPKPDEKRVTDITCVDKGRLVISGSGVGPVFPESSGLGEPQMHDLIGRFMDQSRKRGLAMNALQMALLARNPQQRLLHHSDRGSQYASNDYQKLLKDSKITCSMSRKGNGPEKRFHLRSVTTMPAWRVSLPLSNRNWYTTGNTRPGRKPEETFLNTFRSGITENEGIRHWAFRARNSLKTG